MSCGEMRRASWNMCEQLGLPINLHLPALESALALRPATEVVERALVLNAVVAKSYGYRQAIEWLETENLSEALSPKERDFVFLNEGHAISFQWKAEALTSLAWLIGLIDFRPWIEPAPDSLVNEFPDLRVMAPSAAFRARARLRPAGECLAKLDQAYCVHWACRDLDLRALPHIVETQTVYERRWALEWCLSQRDWDDVSIDT